tara:strand:- start:448 stop:723 length:276 start_codon:yes stop_codon:yes gene_type:complete
MNMIEKVTGWCGGFFYAICYLPQVLGTCKNKSPELNMNFIYLQFLGASSMFLYGLTNKLYPIMALNGYSWICLVLIMGGHFRNERNKQILN